MPKRIVVLIDGENIMIGVHDNGRCVNWVELINKISQYGEITIFDIFLPFYLIPGYMTEMEKILEIVPHAKLIATSEGLFCKDVTDNHMGHVAISLLDDKKATPDILVIGSGDHHFAPIAELFESHGKKVIFFAYDKSTIHHTLEKSVNKGKRDVLFLADPILNLTNKLNSFKIFEDELRMLTQMLLNKEHHKKIQSNDRLFQLVAYAYNLARDLSKRRLKFREIVEEIKSSHKRERNVRGIYHKNDQQYGAIIQMLAGHYIDGDYMPALVKIDDEGFVWYEIDRQSHLALAIESIQ